MKTHLKRFLLAALCLTLISASAQMGGMGGPRPRGSQGPQISASMAKLFGEHTAFSATMEQQVKMGQETTTMPGKMAFDAGKSRFEMNMSEARGTQMPPQAAEQMKAMGMDTTVMISRPDKKMAYIVYPGLEAYVETPIQDGEAAKSDAEFKVETTELAKEEIEGHNCVKNKVVVTNAKGEKHESTVWNATDLKKFPVKIETVDRGQAMTMLFKDVKLSKPDADSFDIPVSYKKYNTMREMMEQEMMKRMGGGMGMPPR
jgi:outer membrane lipoprotein-sorting protein